MIEIFKFNHDCYAIRLIVSTKTLKNNKYKILRFEILNNLDDKLKKSLKKRQPTQILFI